MALLTGLFIGAIAGLAVGVWLGLAAGKIDLSGL